MNSSPASMVTAPRAKKRKEARRSAKKREATSVPPALALHSTSFRGRRRALLAARRPSAPRHYTVHPAERRPRPTGSGDCSSPRTIERRGWKDRNYSCGGRAGGPRSTEARLLLRCRASSESKSPDLTAMSRWNSHFTERGKQTKCSGTFAILTTESH